MTAENNLTQEVKPYASVVIVAGGRGERMGQPKQMLPLGNKPVLVHSIEAFKKCPSVKQIIVVTDVENRAPIRDYGLEVEFVSAGDTRLRSVQNGFILTDTDAEVVAVHDGARPLVDPDKIEQCLAMAREHGAAVLAVPVKDTIKKGEDGAVAETLDRKTLWAAQTPQCYQRALLEQALEKYGSEKDATDESQLVERLGVKVQLVLSDYRNAKLTTPEDLVFARALVEDKFVSRTGFGFDIHRMEFGVKMYLGGAEMIYPKGFVGHSDGDLVLHAICDAVLGALCAGEIGLLFPPSDPSIKGIRSTEIAKKVLDVVREHEASIEHIDATLITQVPKISPHYERIRRSLADVFEMPVEKISFKSKSHEQIGEIGRGEAAMCQAVATLKVKE